MSLEKDIAQMDYSEFCEYLNGEGFDRFEVLLEYDDFTVYQDKKTSRFYYLEGGENDADEFFEVELAAVLVYDINHDIKLGQNETLELFFDCCVCGEQIFDDCIKYFWFQEKTKGIMV